MSRCRKYCLLAPPWYTNTPDRFQKELMIVLFWIYTQQPTLLCFPLHMQLKLAMSMQWKTKLNIFNGRKLHYNLCRIKWDNEILLKTLAIWVIENTETSTSLVTDHRHEKFTRCTPLRTFLACNSVRKPDDKEWQDKLMQCRTWAELLPEKYDNKYR